MKIVQSIQRNREIRKLRQRVRADPTPGHYASLCERMMAHKGPDEVLPLLGEALERFPWSERLQALAFRIRKGSVRRELEDLEYAVHRSPTPDLYGRLAEIHRRIGDDDEAIRYCRECAARFPQNENAYLVEGKIRLERYLRTGLVRDGLFATEKLERAVALNPDNMKARRILSDLYCRVSAWRRARAHLGVILRNSACDDEIRELDRIVREHEIDEPGPVREDLTELLGRGRRAEHPAIRDAGIDLGPQDPRSRSTPRMDELRAELEAIPGVIRVVQQVQIDAHRTSDRPAPHDGGEAVTRVARYLVGIAQDSLVEMDMGNLLHGQISGDWGHMLFFRIASWMVAVQAAPDVNPADIRRRVLSVRSSAAVTGVR